MKLINGENETNSVKDKLCSDFLHRTLEELDSYTSEEEYIENLETIIQTLIEELKDVNSETKHLFGKQGDTEPWIFNESIRIKIYKIIQTLAKLLPSYEDVRIKRETAAKPVNTYTGILKLKVCLTTVEIIASSYKSVFAIKSEYEKFQPNLKFILCTALEIENEMRKALDSSRIKSFIQV